MFQGSLHDVKLPDIIQLMIGSSRTGRFVLKKEESEGRIYLNEGEIVHARCGELSGEEAIYYLAIWDEGTFVFEENVTAEQSTVTKKNTHILMEVARRYDEWRVLSKKIPSLDLIPELETLGNKKVSFNTQEWHVLSKINGVVSITRIAELTSLAPVDVAKLIYGLVASGLVQLRKTPKMEPDPNPLTGTSKPRAPGGKMSAEDEKEWLLGKIEKIYRQSKLLMSEVSHPVIQRHCANGVKAVNSGRSVAAVVDTATQIVKASQLLEPATVTKALTEALRRVIKEP
jgi:hypothetical protein